MFDNEIRRPGFAEVNAAEDQGFGLSSLFVFLVSLIELKTLSQGWRSYKSLDTCAAKIPSIRVEVSAVRLMSLIKVPYKKLIPNRVRVWGS